MTPDAPTERAKAIAREALNDLDALRREADSATDEDRENEASLNGRCAINIILEAAAAIGGACDKQGAVPNAEAIALRYTHAFAAALNLNLGADSENYSHIILAAINDAAAIQRGDGQAEARDIIQSFLDAWSGGAGAAQLYQVVARADKYIKSLESVASTADQANGRNNQRSSPAPVSTPPADKLREQDVPSAKPNETSGATPQ